MNQIKTVLFARINHDIFCLADRLTLVELKKTDQRMKYSNKSCLNQINQSIKGKQDECSDFLLLKVVELDLRCKVEGGKWSRKEIWLRNNEIRKIHKYERNQTT